MRYLIALAVVLFSAALKAEPVDSIWSKANQNYQAGNYAEASKLYDRILKESGESSDLYFNIGNAYFKQNMIGPARLNYERALRLDPENADILYNINFAKSMQLDKIDEVKDMFLTTWFDNVANILSPAGWSVAFFVFLAGALSLFLVYLFTGSFGMRKFSFVAACFMVLLIAVSLVLGNRRRLELLRKDEAVIFAPVVTVKSSPDSTGSDLFIVHEGLKVKILDTDGKWVRIMLSDGKSQGWAPKESMEII